MPINSLTQSPVNKSLQTFPVDDVVSAKQPLFTEALGDHVEKRFKRTVLFVPEPQKLVTNAAADAISKRTGLAKQLSPYLSDAVSRSHPLIDAVDTAFSQHRPLALSPDSVWLVIAQGFAHHVVKNAEALRHRLVRHQKTRKLIEKVFDLSPASFEKAIAGFSRQICEASDPVLHETLICDFSTTSPEIRTASEVVLMDTYSCYFTYGMSCVCGIPRITITGSTDDWQRIRARVEVLETYDLGWWVARVRPILDEFVRTAMGQPNPTFWKAIYKPKQAYAATAVTGWVADLFPYLNDGPARCRNHVFQYERKDWALAVENGIETGPRFFDPEGVSIASFPCGLASVPVTLAFPDGREGELDLVAGFVAVEQDPDDLALSPVISWSVTERGPDRVALP